MDSKEALFAAALQEFIDAHNLTRADVARQLRANGAAKSSPQYVSSRMNGSGGLSVSADIVVAAADAAGVEIEFLVAELAVRMARTAPHAAG